MICGKIALCCTVSLVACLGAAHSAELPSKSAKPPSAAAPAKICTVNGELGFMAGDSGFCVKISGYVSGQVEGGSLTKPQTLIYH